MEKALLDGLLSLMQSTDEVDPWFRGLLYGDSGMRKTTQACTVGARTPDKKLLYVEADPQGWVSLMNHPELRFHPDGSPRIVRMVYQGTTQLDAICQAFEEKVPEFAAFDTIVLDTASNMTILDLDKVVEARAKEDVTGKKSEDAPTKPDYNFNTERMRRRFMRLLALPVHVVFVSHVREDEDKNTEVTYYRPSFSPKTRKTVEQMMHLIAFSTLIEAETVDGMPKYVHKLQVHPTRTITAKSRIGGLPTILVDPVLGDIVQKWLETEEARKPIEEMPEAPMAPESEGLNQPAVAKVAGSDSESRVENDTDFLGLD